MVKTIHTDDNVTAIDMIDCAVAEVGFRKALDHLHRKIAEHFRRLPGPHAKAAGESLATCLEAADLCLRDMEECALGLPTYAMRAW